jgi:hypothetical protein
MLTTLCRAVDSTSGTRFTAGAASLARPLFDLDRFFAAMDPPLRGSSLEARSRRFPVEVDLRSCATIACRASEMLKAGSEREMTDIDGLRIRNAEGAAPAVRNRQVAD